MFIENPQRDVATETMGFTMIDAFLSDKGRCAKTSRRKTNINYMNLSTLQNTSTHMVQLYAIFPNMLLDDKDRKTCEDGVYEALG